MRQVWGFSDDAMAAHRCCKSLNSEDARLARLLVVACRMPVSNRFEKRPPAPAMKSRRSIHPSPDIERASWLGKAGLPQLLDDLAGWLRRRRPSQNESAAFEVCAGLSAFFSEIRWGCLSWGSQQPRQGERRNGWTQVAELCAPPW